MPASFRRSSIRTPFGWLAPAAATGKFDTGVTESTRRTLVSPPSPPSFLFSLCRPESLQNIDIHGGQSYIYTYMPTSRVNELTSCLNHYLSYKTHQDQGRQKCEFETKSAPLPELSEPESCDNSRAVRRQASPSISVEPDSVRRFCQTISTFSLRTRRQRGAR